MLPYDDDTKFKLNGPTFRARLCGTYAEEHFLRKRYFKGYVRVLKVGVIQGVQRSFIDSLKKQNEESTFARGRRRLMITLMCTKMCHGSRPSAKRKHNFFFYFFFI